VFASSSASTRTITPKWREWIAHPYQERSVDFLCDRGAAALFLDPGLGKTSIALDAFRILQEEGVAKKMLVIAPLRVCQLVWEQEAAEWEQFRHFKFSMLHGPSKPDRLNDDADIFLINPEGVPWLVDQFFGKRLPFDTVVIDELTKFKNASAVRHKALCPKLIKIPRVWGLTGTPIPNGYLDLFGQMKILDGGQCLGYYYTKFRSEYFEADYTGFGFLLRRGSSRRLEDKIAPYVLRMSAKDYLDLPKVIDNIITVRMPKKARALYKEMKEEMLVELGEDCIEAGNAAAVYSKLKQMANGAVYAGDGIMEPRKTIHLHDAKIEALEELIGELEGTPLIVAYEFNHDLDRIQKALGGDVPYIGSGVSGAAARGIEKRWNANKIPVLLAHPASAGHGLNFQKGNACHICWFSVTWDYELYDQLIHRIFRQGNKSTRIMNHMLLVENSIDDKTRLVIVEKGLTQGAFFDALNTEICLDGGSASSPDGDEKVTKMVKKLSRRSSRQARQEEEEEVEEEEEEAPRKSKRSSRRASKRAARRDDDDNDDNNGPEEEEVEEEEEEAPRKSKRSGSKRKLRGRPRDDDNDGDGEPEPEEEEEEESLKSKARKRFGKVVKKKLKEEDDDNDDDNDGEDDQKEEEEAAPKRSRKPKRSGKSEDADKVTAKKTYAGALDIDALKDQLGDVIAQKLSDEGEGLSCEGMLSLARAITTLAL